MDAYDIKRRIQMTVFDKITALQGEKRSPAWMVGEQLKDIIRNDTRAQEIVSQDK